jgi:hypothetical protein
MQIAFRSSLSSRWKTSWKALVFVACCALLLPDLVTELNGLPELEAGGSIGDDIIEIRCAWKSGTSIQNKCAKWAT